MVPAALYPAYLPLAQRFNAQHPTLLQVVLSPFTASPALISEMHFEATTALKPAHDGWVFSWVGALSLSSTFPAPGPLTDLDSAAFNVTYSPVVNWADVLGPFQNSSMPSLNPVDAGLASYTTYVPLDGTSPLLFYRTDVLADLGFDHPPATWSELVYMAGLANGSSGGGANGAGGTRLRTASAWRWTKVGHSSGVRDVVDFFEFQERAQQWIAGGRRSLQGIGASTRETTVCCSLSVIDKWNDTH